MTDEVEQLVRRAREGGVAAFRELVEQYQQPLINFALELTGDWDDAEELSQEVFIKVYHALPAYRGGARFMSWLYRIMVNAHIDQCRKRQARGGWSVQSIDDDNRSQTEPLVARAREYNPEQQLAARQLRTHIARALKSLSPQQRSIFIMRHYHDLALKEIALILGISQGTVKSQLFRALRRLRVILAPYRAELGREAPSL